MLYIICGKMQGKNLRFLPCILPHIMYNKIYPCSEAFGMLHPKNLLLFRTKYCIDGCTADCALALQCGLAIFHGHPLAVFHLSLGFALYAIIQVCHDFLPPTSLLEKCDVLSVGTNCTRQVYLVSLRLQSLLHRYSEF